MTGRILVVDDIEVNLRLLSARLAAEYYEVVAVESGEAALQVLAAQPIDLVLLDVMMPGLDGFEVCRRIKATPRLMHVPVVLITALDQTADRVTGLESGADDFLTKPVGDLALMSRVRSLTRLKRVTDELLGRAETAMQMVGGDLEMLRDLAASASRTIAYVEAADEGRLMARRLRSETALTVLDDAGAFLTAAGACAPDVVMVDLAATNHDPLRLISQLRSGEATRMLPIIALAEFGDEVRAARALELGANDYVPRPIDRNELAARLRTQLRRKRYDEGLRRSLQETIQLAIIDPLTGLHNRRFLDIHLGRASKSGDGFALALFDIDHFKRINDGFGHDAGDAVLTEFGRRLKAEIRSSDLACRFGGEEFAVLMPGADTATAHAVAERIRLAVAETAFALAGEDHVITVSAGIAISAGASENREQILKRADEALYGAKRSGRNRIGMAAQAA